jgi:DNA-binding response OmpR family regulator
MKHILIIEDDLSILRGLKDVLSEEGYEVSVALDGEAGYRLVREREPHLIVLDIMLPGMDGFEFCRKLRKAAFSTPILMLTARGGEADRVKGLDLGADDYVAKPFSLPELLARIRALLRRGKESSEVPVPDVLKVGDVTVDFRRYEARRGDEELEMSRKEFGILRCLASRPGEVFSRTELLDEVWGEDSFPTTRTVDNRIASLRAKIEVDPGQPRYLVTMHGVGYKLVIDEEERG